VFSFSAWGCRAGYGRLAEQCDLLRGLARFSVPDNVFTEVSPVSAAFGLTPAASERSFRLVPSGDKARAAEICNPCPGARCPATPLWLSDYLTSS
jgi:hypothetical protein